MPVIFLCTCAENGGAETYYTAPVVRTTATPKRNYVQPAKTPNISLKVFPLQSALPGYTFSDPAPLKKGLSGVSIFGAG